MKYKLSNNSRFLVFYSLTLLFSSCMNNQSGSVNTPQPTTNTDTPLTLVNKITSLDTVSRLENQKDSVVIFKSPGGQYYVATLTDSEGNAFSPSTSLMRAPDSLYCITDIFLGTHRKTAKTTILQKTIQAYNSVALLNATLQADSIMRNLSPPITNASGSPRVTQEKRNVKIKKAFVYAISREDDNDFHLIIGDSLPFNAANSINVEVSGLPDPPNSSYDTLLNVRAVIENFFGEKCSGNYTVFSPPIPVTLSGSLFYDIDHAPGIVGTGIYKPLTSWEIHPVKNFVFR